MRHHARAELDDAVQAFVEDPGLAAEALELVGLVPQVISTLHTVRPLVAGDFQAAADVDDAIRLLDAV